MCMRSCRLRAGPLAVAEATGAQARNLIPDAVCALLRKGNATSSGTKLQGTEYNQCIRSPLTQLLLHAQYAQRICISYSSA